MKKTTLPRLLPLAGFLLLVGTTAHTETLHRTPPSPSEGQVPSEPSTETSSPREEGPSEPRITDPTSTVPSDPTGALTLELALATALLHSPELESWTWEIRAREAAELQSGARPNPELGLGIENLGSAGERAGAARASETSLTLSQVFELGGKRGKRRTLAREDLGLATRDHGIARTALLAETTKAFFGVLAAQERLALSRELTSVAEEVLVSVSRRVAAGSSSPVEENRARVELESARIDRDRAERSLGAARIRLASLWGGPQASFSEVIGNLRELAPLPSRESLRTRVEGSPQAERWNAILDHHNAALELERAGAVPDLSLGSGLRYSADPGEVSFLLEVSVPLPLFDRNRGATAAASMQLERARSERRAYLVRLEAEAATLQAELLATESEIRSLETLILPEAEAAFRASQDAYLRGGMRLNDVLDSERALYELKTRQIEALVRFHTTRVDLGQLLGEPPSSFTEPPAGSTTPAPGRPQP